MLTADPWPYAHILITFTGKSITGEGILDLRERERERRESIVPSCLYFIYFILAGREGNIVYIVEAVAFVPYNFVKGIEGSCGKIVWK